jgi:hypothetical protein
MVRRKMGGMVRRIFRTCADCEQGVFDRLVGAEEQRPTCDTCAAMVSALAAGTYRPKEEMS